MKNQEQTDKTLQQHAATYSSDSPIVNREEDRFGRAPFAKAIVKGLVSLVDPSSLAIGIYGPWGDGKSTVLNFIDEEIKNDKTRTVISMHFNPWRFGDENALLLSFFHALARTLKQSLVSQEEELAKEIRDFLPSIPYFGQIAKNLADKVANIDIEEFKRRTEDLLKSKKTRVAVLMDDIDRLEQKEIQAVFRLVKLTANFNQIAYVLAFDDKMVAAALQESYGSFQESGRGFLEKIIQVPLHLPRIPSWILAKFCLDCVNSATNSAGVKLTPWQNTEYTGNFNLLRTFLNTPRQCKRYANALTFALQLLKEEVNCVDLMTIEAIRIFLPRLYEIIRSHGRLFLEYRRKSSDVEDSRVGQMIGDIVSPALNDRSLFEHDVVKGLVIRLFPNLESDKQPKSSSDDQPEWEEAERQYRKEQRICSKYYFDTFFAYSIPPGNISDSYITWLSTAIADHSVSEIVASIKETVKVRGEMGSNDLVSLLDLRQQFVDPTVCRVLAPAIARSDFFVKNFATMYLVSDLVGRIPLENWAGVLMQIVEDFPEEIGWLTRGLEFIVWHCVRRNEWRAEGERFSAENYDILRGALEAKIATLYSTKPIHENVERDWPELFKAWRNCTSEEQVRSWLEKSVRSEPGNALRIVRWILPNRDFGAEEGKKYYKEIGTLVGHSLLLDELRREYGEALDSATSLDASDDLLLAQRFYALSRTQEEKL